MLRDQAGAKDLQDDPRIIAKSGRIKPEPSKGCPENQEGTELVVEIGLHFRDDGLDGSKAFGPAIIGVLTILGTSVGRHPPHALFLMRLVDGSQPNADLLEVL